ncbi:MotE family protein [Niallia nealsonii]|uniref:Magnesium transporter MgtE intracellular domain-containing protein n=1 Tax=Niallia nealsonii TaxID=115979 RepID=A0A2N0Z6P4_9BACI|nr:hypothetical protein [Niallia nealsonii]PKG25167.1 hypothetical protein CWS01_02590 [Niallia nealsonii]
MDNLEEEKKKKFNIFQRILLVVIIPILFAVVVVLLLLIYSGVDVADKGKDLVNAIPFLTSEKASTETSTSEQTQKDAASIKKLEAKIAEQEETIANLQTEIDNKDKINKNITEEREKLQKELDALKSEQTQTKTAFDDIVKTYETMSAKNAAAIISEMGENEGLKILASVKPAELASILEKMEPSVASKYTELLADNSSSDQGSTSSSTGDDADNE